MGELSRWNGRRIWSPGSSQFVTQYGQREKIVLTGWSTFEQSGF
jgi:hypothetical protein